MANNYDINYNDDRFQKVEADKKVALSDIEKTYGDMISQSDSYFDKQIAASEQLADKQSQLQQEQTDFAIEQIQQQKDQAKKDYTKEQSGAYVDWQKQSNQYGANAENVAAGGLQNSGFAESSQVSMYNTYQNRVATARESYNRAVLNYDNAMKDARLQNNAALAEIAYKALQQQLELSLQGFQYKNQLLIEQANKKTEVDNNYYGRYQDVLQQINTENALAEQIRQYNEKMAEEKRQYNESLAFQKEQLAEEQRQFNEQMAAKKASSSGGGGGSGGKSSGTATISNGGGSNIGSVAKPNGSTAPKSSTPTNNMNSIIALGYGPISEAYLAKLLTSGQVTRTLKNGQWYYSRKTTAATKPTSRYSTNRLKNMGLSYR